MGNNDNLEVTEQVAMAAAWKCLAIRWELTWQERTALLPSGGEDSGAPPEDTETRMRILVEIGYRLRMDDDAELCEWLRIPTELWGWYSPIEVMSGPMARLRLFRAYVEAGLGL